MRFPLRRMLACALIAGLAAPASVFATNGYFLIGYGSKSRAMGGVGVALGQDGLAAANNPATMMDLRKTRVDMSAELFVPYRSAKHKSNLLPTHPDANGNADWAESGQDLFLIPSMGGVYKFNRKLRMGMAVVGAGAGTRYSQGVSDDPNNPDAACSDAKLASTPPPRDCSNFFNFNGNAGREELGVLLLQMQMLPSVAYQFYKSKKYGEHTVGASLAIAIGAFRARGLGAFGTPGIGFTKDTTKLTDNGVDFSFGSGIRVGWLGRFAKKTLNVGVNYSSKVYMTPFEKYRGLFAERGQFDIPENFAFGVAYKPTKQWTVAADVMRVFYSNVPSIGNRGPAADANGDGFFNDCPVKDTDVEACFPGGKYGLGFGWHDQTVYKLGVAYDYNKKWTFRGGLNYGKSPIQEDQILFNLLAPATVEKHLTFGVSYRPNKANEFSFNFMRAFENTISGPTIFQETGVPKGTQFNNGFASMNQYSVGATWGINI